MKVGDELHPALTGALMATTPKTPTDLLFEILAESTKPGPEEGQEDYRPTAIEEAVREARPEVRTRAAQLATALVPILVRCRSTILAVKSEEQDADVTHGDAEVLPDGWLLVKMAGEVIGRVPFNPERGMEDAGRMAEEILAEHVRLHVARATEVVRIPIPENVGDEPPRPDGVRARRLVVR
jgi:hypothetical protein